MERFVTGTAELIEAEFGVIYWRPVLYIFVAFYNNEVTGIDGFDTYEEMKTYILSENIPNVEYFL